LNQEIQFRVAEQAFGHASMQEVTEKGVPFKRLFHRQGGQEFTVTMVHHSILSALAVGPLEHLTFHRPRNRKREVRLPRTEFIGTKELQ